MKKDYLIGTIMMSYYRAYGAIFGEIIIRELNYVMDCLIFNESILVCGPVFNSGRLWDGSIVLWDSIPTCLE